MLIQSELHADRDDSPPVQDSVSCSPEAPDQSNADPIQIPEAPILGEDAVDCNEDAAAPERNTAETHGDALDMAIAQPRDSQQAMEQFISTQLHRVCHHPGK